MAAHVHNRRHTGGNLAYGADLWTRRVRACSVGVWLTCDRSVDRLLDVSILTEHVRSTLAGSRTYELTYRPVCFVYCLIGHSVSYCNIKNLPRGYPRRTTLYYTIVNYLPTVPTYLSVQLY